MDADAMNTRRAAHADGSRTEAAVAVTTVLAELNEGLCPYFIRDRGKGVIYCECAKFHFPDRLTRREIIYRYCAHPDGYKDCMIKQSLDHYYERKYAQHDGEDI